MPDPNKIQFKSSQEIDGKQSLLLIDLINSHVSRRNLLPWKYGEEAA